MRVVIVRDGERQEVDLADDLSWVRWRDRSYPVRVVAHSATRVELEIAGEKVAVEGWPDRYPAPLGPVDVDGERWRVEATVDRGNPRPSPTLAPPAAPAPAGPPSATPPTGPGTAVLPPMPGKVVELRVSEGDRVSKGQVLLVLEAMKMRNEIASPSDGHVRGLSVAAGANVRAREVLLRIEPDAGAA